MHKGVHGEKTIQSPGVANAMGTHKGTHDFQRKYLDFILIHFNK